MTRRIPNRAGKLFVFSSFPANVHGSSVECTIPDKSSWEGYSALKQFILILTKDGFPSRQIFPVPPPPFPPIQRWVYNTTIKRINIYVLFNIGRGTGGRK